MYTQEYLDSIDQAIMELQSGKRVTSVWYGDTRVQYAEVDLDKLIKLRTKVNAAVRGDSTRQVVFSTSKGIR